MDDTRRPSDEALISVYGYIDPDPPPPGSILEHEHELIARLEAILPLTAIRDLVKQGRDFWEFGPDDIWDVLSNAFGGGKDEPAADARGREE